MTVRVGSDRAAFITAGRNITSHEAFPGNALPWPPYLGANTAVHLNIVAVRCGHLFEHGHLPLHLVSMSRQVGVLGERESRTVNLSEQYTCFLLQCIADNLASQHHRYTFQR